MTGVNTISKYIATFWFFKPVTFVQCASNQRPYQVFNDDECLDSQSRAKDYRKYYLHDEPRRTLSFSPSTAPIDVHEQKEFSFYIPTTVEIQQEISDTPDSSDGSSNPMKLQQYEIPDPETDWNFINESNSANAESISTRRPTIKPMERRPTSTPTAKRPTSTPIAKRPLLSKSKAGKSKCAKKGYWEKSSKNYIHSSDVSDTNSQDILDSIQESGIGANLSSIRVNASGTNDPSGTGLLDQTESKFVSACTAFNNNEVFTTEYPQEIKFVYEAVIGESVSVNEIVGRMETNSAHFIGRTMIQCSNERGTRVIKKDFAIQGIDPAPIDEVSNNTCTHFITEKLPDNSNCVVIQSLLTLYSTKAEDTVSAHNALSVIQSEMNEGSSAFLESSGPDLGIEGLKLLRFLYEGELPANPNLNFDRLIEHTEGSKSLSNGWKVGIVVFSIIGVIALILGNLLFINRKKGEGKIEAFHDLEEENDTCEESEGRIFCSEIDDEIVYSEDDTALLEKKTQKKKLLEFIRARSFGIG